MFERGNGLLSLMATDHDTGGGLEDVTYLRIKNLNTYAVANKSLIEFIIGEIDD